MHAGFRMLSRVDPAAELLLLHIAHQDKGQPDKVNVAVIAGMGQEVAEVEKLVSALMEGKKATVVLQGGVSRSNFYFIITASRKVVTEVKATLVLSQGPRNTMQQVEELGPQVRNLLVFSSPSVIYVSPCLQFVFSNVFLTLN